MDLSWFYPEGCKYTGYEASIQSQPSENNADRNMDPDSILSGLFSGLRIFGTRPNKLQSKL